MARVSNGLSRSLGNTSLTALVDIRILIALVLYIANKPLCHLFCSALCAACSLKS